MSLEAYTGNISDLVDSNPTPTDPKSQGDDHLRGIKYTLKQSFPNFTGPVNAKNEAIDQAVSDGLGFCKNKLFNGEVTRINQRGFDGNWATKNIWASGNTIAQQELCYGYDMWAKASATDMLQVIEAGNFRPSTVHTLSGIGVTTQQITSPASGNWTITVPQTARNVQVEEGVEATPFEIRPTGFELAQCQRYYEQSYPIGTNVGQGGAYLPGIWNETRNVGGSCSSHVRFKVPKRIAPDMRLWDRNGNINSVGTLTSGGVFTTRAGTIARATESVVVASSASTTDPVIEHHFAASAVI